MSKRVFEQSGRRKCAGDCNLVRPREDYSTTQWDKPAGHACCKGCVQKSGRPGGPVRVQKKCAGGCQLERAKVDYSATQWKNREGYAVCIECADKRNGQQAWECRRCHVEKPASAFSMLRAAKPGDMHKPGKRRCNVCVEDERASRPCGKRMKSATLPDCP